ncbi:MAG: M15 family metallopeptidase [Bacteroidetes bacterium]|nr:M15 family metallopeptidase [Bacteroidota bacterium]
MTDPKAVDDFWNWAKDKNDIKMKKYFYPNFQNKKDLFKGYIAKKSKHSRGSTIDLTIIDINLNMSLNTETYKDNSIEMGTIFDFLDPKANTFSNKISKEALKNRLILRNLMIKNGFKPYDKEWWHFTLRKEPFKNKYFNFTIK